MTASPEAVFDQVVGRAGAAWLDGGSASQGWSILTWGPTEVITQARDWPDALRSMARGGARSSLPFPSGVLGFIGYGAGHVADRVPTSSAAWEPHVWLGRYEGALSYRHADKSWHVHGPRWFCEEAKAMLQVASELPPPPPAPVARTTTTPQPEFEAAVGRILAWLREGDCYQVNLTRPVLLEGAGDPWPAYRRLRARSAPAYGAYLDLGDRLAILCNSPELHLEVRGRAAASLPIKGTRPRSHDPSLDAALAQELELALKDRAELTMIVDLVRNDLGRVAELGSVRAGPRTVTAHANVHHASQRVQCTLALGLDATHALAATFPPGSVTGAPKVRACERIAELEAHPRGAYCGTIGYLADGGDSTWNVAIRTAVFQGDRARYHVGGGVVVDSEPTAEWDETVDKGTALAAALAGAERI